MYKAFLKQIGLLQRPCFTSSSSTKLYTFLASTFPASVTALLVLPVWNSDLAEGGAARIRAYGLDNPPKPGRHGADRWQ